MTIHPPEPDEMPGQPWAPHPSSLRSKEIAYWLEVQRVHDELTTTRQGRLLWRLWVVWTCIRREI
jgi:hypothetical protein